MPSENTDLNQTNLYFVYEFISDLEPKIRLLNANISEAGRFLNKGESTIQLHVSLNDGYLEADGFIIIQAMDLKEANKVLKRRRNGKSNLFVYKVSNDTLEIVLPFARITDAMALTHQLSTTNIYNYLKGIVNTLNGFVVVSADDLITANGKALKRYLRSRLYLKSEDIKKLSDEQVEKIINVLNEANIKGGTAVQTKRNKKQ